MKTIINAITAGLIIAAAIFAVKEWRDGRELVGALNAAAATRSALDADARRLEQQIASANQTRASLATELNALPRVADGSNGATAKKDDTKISPGSPVVDAIINDPKFQNLQFEARRASLDATYGPLLAKLGLSREQVEKFKDILLKHDEERMDSYAIRKKQGIGKDDSVFAQIDAQADSELENTQKALLGESGYQQLQDYERSVPARKMADAFAGKAAIAGVPLTMDQAEQLAQLLANTSPDFRNGGPVGEIDWSAALAPASAILSDAQIGLIKGTILPNQYLQQINELAKQPAQPGRE